MKSTKLVSSLSLKNLKTQQKKKKKDKMLTEKVVINGRKIPLSAIRCTLFKKNEKYVPLSKDLNLKNMSCHQVAQRLRKINEYNHDNRLTKLNVLIDKLKRYERTRHLMTWNDGSYKVLIVTFFTCPSLSFD